MRLNSVGFLLGAVVGVAGCSDSAGPDQPIVYGAPVTVGNGQARSYIISKGSAPTELGIALSEEALQGLPAGSTPMDSKSYVLPLPTENNSGYTIVELNWNPVGHPPPMVYTVPHFDFHFYTLPQQEWASILPSDPQFGAKAGNLPPAGSRPAGYAADSAGPNLVAIPMMGVHWVDHAGPEFNGSAFTHTFIFGSWDGRFTFVEPMVALSYLQTKPEVQAAVTQPPSYPDDGYRPTGYRVSWNAAAKEYRIGITGLRLVAGD